MHIHIHMHIIHIHTYIGTHTCTCIPALLSGAVGCARYIAIDKSNKDKHTILHTNTNVASNLTAPSSGPDTS